MILIAGNCVIEDYKTLKKTAEVLAKASKITREKIDLYFKASCLKDNRTNLNGYRGPGIKKGVRYLELIKKEFGIKITTDFHSEIMINNYHHYVDLIQIPAYLCMQTSLLETAGRTGKKVHIKKGQFIAPEDIKKLFFKAFESGAKEVFITDRGTGYGNNLWMDPRNIRKMRKNLKLMWEEKDVSFLVDITHPNKGGNWEDAFVLGTSYLMAGADGIFLETHPDPKNAKCDNDTQIPLKNMWDWINKFDKLSANYRYANPY